MVTGNGTVLFSSPPVPNNAELAAELAEEEAGLAEEYEAP